MIRYNDINVQINGSGVLAQNVSLDNSPSLNPVISLGYRKSFGLTQSAPINNNININYFLDTVYDYNFNLINYLKTGFSNNHQPTQIIVGEVTGSGYLTNLSFKADPNGPVVANASYVSFNELVGNLSTSKKFNVKYSNGSGIAHGYTLFLSNTGNNINVFNLDYSFNANWKPTFTFNNPNPQVNFCGGTETVRIEQDTYVKTGLLSGLNYTGYLGTSGAMNITCLGLSALKNLTHSSLIVNLSGAKITSTNLSFNVDDFVRNQITAINYI